MRRGSIIVSTVLTMAAGLGGGAAAQSLPQLRITAAQIAALPSTTAPNGLRTTLILGDPTRPGPYTIAVLYPPHARVAPHTHRDNRTAIVISGTWFFGYGAVADDAATRAVDAGGIYVESATQPHYGHGGDQPALVYVSGFGPSDTVPVKP